MSNHCLHDGFPYSGETYHFPNGFRDNRYIVSDQETFCSLSCAFKWALERRKPVHDITNFKNMCRDVYDVCFLIPAPRRCFLNIYKNGHLSIDEFRAKSSRQGTTVLGYDFDTYRIKYSETNTPQRKMPLQPKPKNNLMKFLSKRKRKQEDETNK